MGVITKVLKQTCVWWDVTTSTSGGIGRDANGQPILTSPVEISCRWTDKTQEYIDSTGAKQMSHTGVMVDRDVTIGGVLMLGELTDIINAVNVKENDNAWEIKSFKKVSNFRNTEYFRKALL